MSMGPWVESVVPISVELVAAEIDSTTSRSETLMPDGYTSVSRCVFCRSLTNGDFLHFVLPAKDNRVRVDLGEVEMNTVNQLLFAGDADAAKHAACHLTE